MLMCDADALLELSDRTGDVAFVKVDNAHCIVQTKRRRPIGDSSASCKRALDLLVTSSMEAPPDIAERAEASSLCGSRAKLSMN